MFLVLFISLSVCVYLGITSVMVYGFGLVYYSVCLCLFSYYVRQGLCFWSYLLVCLSVSMWLLPLAGRYGFGLVC